MPTVTIDADELEALRKDAERYAFVFPIIAAEGEEGDRRAIALARQLAAGLGGNDAVDAARKRAD